MSASRPRRIGLYEVTRLVDGVYKAPVDHLMHLTRPDRVEEFRRVWGRSAIDMPVNLFVLEDSAGVTLVDAGAGASWGPAYGHARAALDARGVEPAQVRRIMLTHLHGDHALGLLDDGAPRFQNAEICVPADELAFFTDARAREATAPERRGAFDVAARLVAAYAARLTPLAGATTPAPGVALMALPGHTPGHAGYLIGEGAGALLLFGDVVHLADMQAGDPDLGFVYDVDPAQAARSRRQALDRAARSGWIVSGGHIDGFARVERNGAVWRLAEA